MKILSAGVRVGIDITTQAIEVEHATSSQDQIHPSSLIRRMKKRGEEDSRKKVLFGIVREVRTGEDLWDDYGEWEGHKDVIGTRKGKPIYGPPVQIPKSGVWYTIDLDKRGQFVILPANDERIIS